MRSETHSLRWTRLPIWISIGAFSGKQIALLNSKELSSLQPRMAAFWQRSGGLTLVMQPQLPPRGHERNAAAHVEKRKTNQRGLITLTFCLCLSRGSGWIYTILERPRYPPLQSCHHTLNSLRVRDLPQFLFFFSPKGMCNLRKCIAFT